MDSGIILKGRYIVGRVLGSGGFGITYKVCDTGGRGICAVKEYAPDRFAFRGEDGQSMKIKDSGCLKGYRKNLERFVEEAVLLQQIRGTECIVQVYDFFQENSTAYYVMEYVDGPSLYQVVKANPRAMHFEDATDIIVRVGRAMDRVHRETGKIHADISPENILVGKDGKIRLIDFGSAKRIMQREAPDEEITLKLKYAPPELFRREMPKGPYTDIYELAATFYFCLCGDYVPAFPERNRGKTYVPLYQRTTDVPRNVSDAVDRALVLDYTQRTQSLAEFISQVSSSLFREEEQPCIHVLNGEMQGQYCTFLPEEELVIGRLPEEAQMVIPGYGRVVSRKHLLVRYDKRNRVFVVKDLDSKNGTWLNGQSLVPQTEYRLEPGTILDLSRNGCRILLGTRTVRRNSVPMD